MSNPVADNREFSSCLAGQACVAADGGNSQLSVGFGILCLEVCPDGFLLLNAFIASVNTKEY